MIVWHPSLREKRSILFSEGEDTAHISQRESCSVSG